MISSAALADSSHTFSILAVAVWYASSLEPMMSFRGRHTKSKKPKLAQGF